MLPPGEYANVTDRDERKTTDFCMFSITLLLNQVLGSLRFPLYGQRNSLTDLRQNHPPCIEFGENEQEAQLSHIVYKI